MFWCLGWSSDTKVHATSTPYTSFNDTMIQFICFTDLLSFFQKITYTLETQHYAQPSQSCSLRYAVLPFEDMFSLITGLWINENKYNSFLTLNHPPTQALLIMLISGVLTAVQPAGAPPFPCPRPRGWDISLIWNERWMAQMLWWCGV